MGSVNDAEAEALGRRWLRAGGGWRPGMLWQITRLPPLESYFGRIDERGYPPVGPAWPDLRDDATRGAALAVVRERWGDPALYVRLSGERRLSDGVHAWEVLGWADAAHSPNGRPGSWRGWGYATEAEALVAALEAAPEVPRG